MELLSEYLKSTRQARGLTQEGLAERAGLSVFAIRQYEQGRRVPDLWSAYQLSKALGLRLETLAERAK